MTEFLLKAALVTGAGLLFYKLVLQGESFFAANRVFLAGCIASAFLLPHLALPPLVDHQGYVSLLLRQVRGAEAPEKAPAFGEAGPADRPGQSLDRAAEAGEAKAPGSTPVYGQRGWPFWGAVLYGFGVIVFTLHLLFQAGSILLQAIRSPDKFRDGGCLIVNTERHQAPCSFFGCIFIYPAAYDHPTYEQIIAHEKIHARMWHTLDLLLAEIAVILLWFNPFAWLLKREIEKNLEYQTDAALLATTSVSREQYQMSLLRIAAPDKPLTITTHYNQSLLKQRIVMMNAKRSTPHRYWKYAFLAPLLFGTLLLLNEPAASQDVPVPVADANPARVVVPEVNPVVNAGTAGTSPQEEERTISEFHSLTVSGLAVVYLSQGETGKAKLAVSGMPIEDVITRVEGGVLTVTTRGQHNGESIKVYVSSPAVRSITVDGAGQLYGENTLKAQKLVVSAAGHGAAKLRVDVQDLRVHMKGGDLDITGKTKSYQVFNLENSSHGTLSNHGLSVGD